MILILNPGSSSLKAKLYDDNLELKQELHLQRIGDEGEKNHKSATANLLEKIKDIDKVNFFGYRVVHGLDLRDPEEIDDEVIKHINKASKYAPLHNPPALEVIDFVKKDYPEAKHIAVFDTSYFVNLPESAKVYPLPFELYQEGIKRYGFHGISHEYAYDEAMKAKQEDHKEQSMITVHLGQGCSVTAIKNGEPIDTSMGLTPLEGLPMITRSGSIDPGIIIHLLREKNMDANQIENILEKKSGLLGISGISSDMRDILFVAGIEVEDKKYKPPKETKCTQEDVDCAKLAVEVFVNSVKKYIGAYAALLSRISMVVFTGEIGYGSSNLRKMIMSDLNIESFAIKPNEELAIAQKISQMRK